MRLRAFTLLEVILVIAILGMIAVFAFPDLGEQMRQRSLMESAERLRSLILMSHAKAMQEGLRYRIQFPGTPDPLDRFADKEIDRPFETKQPELLRQRDQLGNRDAFDGYGPSWKPHNVLMDGTRCVMAYPGLPSFDTSHGEPIAGRSIMDEQVEFVSLTLNPDGTCDYITFVLTDLPMDVELEKWHAPRILNVVVDGRTGYTWIQRAMRSDEIDVMEEIGARPIFYRDFVRPDEITEVNVVDVFMGESGAMRGRLRGTD